MNRLGEAFNKPTIEPFMEPYWEDLKTIPDYDFVRAVSKSIATDEQFPKVPHLREHLGVRYQDGMKADHCARWGMFLCPRCEFDFTETFPILRSDPLSF